mgnify:CR=1 FL=1
MNKLILYSFWWTWMVIEIVEKWNSWEYNSKSFTQDFGRSVRIPLGKCRGSVRSFRWNCANAKPPQCEAPMRKPNSRWLCETMTFIFDFHGTFHGTMVPMEKAFRLNGKNFLETPREIEKGKKKSIFRSTRRPSLPGTFQKTRTPWGQRIQTSN